MSIYLETSSYLPLIWTTPYSQSVIDLMSRQVNQHNFVMQRDCIAEASGYLSFKEDWRYNPAVRFLRLADAFQEAELQKMPFPSTAIQLLLGGNIWPQAQYLNFVRHTAFFFIDLLDNISYRSRKAGLREGAHRIEQRMREFRDMFESHLHSTTLRLPTSGILPYWGKWYLPELPKPFLIEIVDDPRPYNMTSDKLRDVYHYDCAVNAVSPPSEMLVANTGFERNIRTSFASLPIPIRCAETISSRLFGKEYG